MQLEPQQVYAHGVRIQRTEHQPQSYGQDYDNDECYSVQAQGLLTFRVIDALAQSLTRLEMWHVLARQSDCVAGFRVSTHPGRPVVQ